MSHNINVTQQNIDLQSAQDYRNFRQKKNIFVKLISQATDVTREV
jgi:hypothetical protein